MFKIKIPKYKKNQWLSFNPVKFSYWHTAVKKSGVLYPKTIVITTDCDLIPLCEKSVKEAEKQIEFKALIEMLQLAGQKLGYPCFLRNSAGSDKHNFKDACLVNSKDEMSEKVLSTLQSMLMKDLFFALDEWVIREYIPPVIKEFGVVPSFGNMPLRAERRYFFKDKKILAHCEYWIKEAIEHDEMVDLDYLNELNFESDEEVKFLMRETKKIANILPGFWSIDWMKGANNKWYCIDMAPGGVSYQPDKIKDKLK